MYTNLESYFQYLEMLALLQNILMCVCVLCKSELHFLPFIEIERDNTKNFMVEREKKRISIKILLIRPFKHPQTHTL